MSKKTLTLPDESFNKPDAIPELEDAAERYAEYRDARMASGTQERGAKLELLGLMSKHKLETYTSADGDLTIIFDVNEAVKVRQNRKKTEPIPPVTPEPENEGEGDND